MTRDQWAAFIRRNAPRYGVDPAAALAVAAQEGLSGGVGDAGTSFGPFQLHIGGALPRGRGRTWAESPAGILYALSRIGQVAGGMTGRQAVENIVRRFERPANPDREIAGALAAYGNYGGSIGDAVANAVVPGAPPTEIPAGRAPRVIPGTGKPRRVTQTINQRVFDQSALAQGIFGSLATGETPDVSNLVSGAWRTVPLVTTSVLPPVPGMARPNPPARLSAPGSRTPGPLPPVGKLGGALAEAFYDPLGSYDTGRFGGAIGGHMDHVHLSIIRANAMLQAIKRAQAMGLRVGENPYVDKVDPVHVRGSFHYKTFPGQYGGRSLGEGIDVSGDAAKMAAYYRWATQNLR